MAPTADDLLKAEYSLYVVKYKKNYKSLGEFNKRMRYFETNKHLVHKHNKENKSFKLKLNAFADMSPEEQNLSNGFNFGSKDPIVLKDTLPVVNVS